MNTDQIDRRIAEIETELLRDDPTLRTQFLKPGHVNRRHDASVLMLRVSSAVLLVIGLATMSTIIWLVGAVSLIASFAVTTRVERDLRDIRRSREWSRRPRHRAAHREQRSR